MDTINRDEMGRTVTVLLTGLSSALMQVTALREFLAAFSGNELVLGVSLALWLLTLGAGSAVGRTLHSPSAFSFSFLLAGLSALLLQFIPAVRHILAFEPGEIIPFGATVAAATLTLAPVCLVIGVQFPLAVSFLGGRTARAYALEAAGMFLGGAVFTFAAAGRAGAPLVLAAVSAVNIAAGAFLLRSWRAASLLIVPLLMLVSPPQFPRLFGEEDFGHAIRADSRYGSIEVVQNRDQANVYASGKFQFAYPDLPGEESDAHLAMTLHPSPARVLLVGGSPAVAREILKYPKASVDLVETDPDVLRLAMGLLSAEDRVSLVPDRFRALTTDARTHLSAQRSDSYDLIVINLGEPSRANINRCYTVEFFREIKRAIQTDGVVVLSLPPSSEYPGRSLQAAHSSIYRSLKDIFPHTVNSSREFGIFAASSRPIDASPDVLRRRFANRGAPTSYFHEYILDDAFDPQKTAMAAESFETAIGLNRDSRPLTYFYNLLMWAEMQGGRSIAFVLDHGEEVVRVAVFLIIAAALFFLGKKRAVSYSVFLTGYAAMSYSITILLSYQAAFGYVYYSLGLLSATFMAGIALGATVPVSGNPLLRLRLFEGAVVILLASSLFLLKHEVLYYVLNTLVGTAAGASFSAALQWRHSKDAQHIAGGLYGADLAGSFLGALLTAVIIIPLFGMKNAFLMAVLLKTVSLGLLFSLKDEKTSVQQ